MGRAAVGGRVAAAVATREKEIRGSGGSLEPPGPLRTHLHAVCMACSECLPTRLNPLAERTCFSQVATRLLLPLSRRPLRRLKPQPLAPLQEMGASARTLCCAQ